MTKCIRSVALMLLAFSATSALADKAATEEAKRHFQRSKELYDDGDLSGALNELDRSYSAVQNFKLLYNMGQIQAQQQNHAAALKSFQKFLNDGGNEVGEARRTEVLREIDKLRTRVAELTIVVNVEGAEITVDDVLVGKSPLPGPLVVNIGKRKLSATLQNHFPALKQVDLVGLDQVTVRLEPQAMVSKTAPSVSSGIGTSPSAVSLVEKPARFPLWVPWAVTGALAAGTVFAGVWTLKLSGDQQRLLGTYPISPKQQTDAANATRGTAVLTDVLGICAIAAAAGSLIFTLVREPDDAAHALKLGVSPGGLFVAGEFE